MLALQKSKDLVEQIHRIFRRLEHIKQVKKQLYDFIYEVQQLNSTFSQKIHKQMIVFEQKVIKNTLYSTHKTNEIINMAKIYRQFSIQLQKNSKINIINLQKIKIDDIEKQEMKLQKKCDLFLKQFQQYLESQKKYKQNFDIYNNKCNNLDKVITKCQFYQDPVAFYNQTLTNDHLLLLDKQYNECSNFETTIINQAQGLDQTRKWMTQHIKQINQYYVILLHIYLVIIQSIIKCLVDPKNEQNIQKKKLGLRNSQMQSKQNERNLQLQKLNNLYASQLNGNNNKMDDNIIEQYSQLFRKSFNQNQLNSDYKFFYDRCDSIRTKKLKTTDEIFKIQKILIQQLSRQKQNYIILQKQYKNIQRDIFTNNGIDSYKKRFRKYFGSNFMQIQQLCFNIIQKNKKSLDKIGRSMQDNYQKLNKLIDSKQQNIKLFEKRTKIIMDDHLKLKQKTLSNNTVNSQDIKYLKQNIIFSFNQLKKSFIQLQKNQLEIDKLFYYNLKNHYQIILKQAINKNLNKILEKQKNRLNILQTLNVDSEIVLILKQDSRYQMLLNQCPKPNLYSSFQSLVKKHKFDETKKLLQQKQNTLKNMIRKKKGCCGITSQPIKNNVLTSHQCKLITDNKIKGILNITSTGIIFQEKSWNPFYDGLRLMIPQSDINGFDTKKINQKQSVQIGTRLGNIIFQSKLSNQIIQSMQKNITFKPIIKQASQKGKRNDSSSFLKNNTSTQFKLSYDKSLPKNPSNSDILKPLNNKNGQAKSKSKSIDNLIKEFLQKWKDSDFFAQNFVKVANKSSKIQKTSRRIDYTYKNGYSKFYLKERRDYEIQGKNIILNYEWKISFPDSPMLHSFKHSEKVNIQGISKDLKIRIITGKYCEQQLYIKNKFYKQVEQMNNRLSKFIVNNFEKQADILIQPQNDDNRSIDSCNIIIDEINLQQRESKFDRGDTTLRNSKLERQRSSILFNNSNGFKNQSN